MRSGNGARPQQRPDRARPRAWGADLVERRWVKGTFALLGHLPTGIGGQDAELGVRMQGRARRPVFRNCAVSHTLNPARCARRVQIASSQAPTVGISTPDVSSSSVRRHPDQAPVAVRKSCKFRRGSDSSRVLLCGGLRQPRMGGASVRRGVGLGILRTAKTALPSTAKTALGPMRASVPSRSERRARRWHKPGAVGTYALRVRSA
jgi:hypothetical protein